MYLKKSLISMRDFTRNIEGLEHYHICRSGKLYSDWSGVWKLVKPIVKNSGYVSNNLVISKRKRVNVYRHRLVALAWIPNPENLPCVCHKDNNPLNNKVSNLYWGTQEDNVRQCINDGNFYFVGNHKTRR